VIYSAEIFLNRAILYINFSMKIFSLTNIKTKKVKNWVAYLEDAIRKSVVNTPTSSTLMGKKPNNATLPNLKNKILQ
jgi:hypothetical protein